MREGSEGDQGPRGMKNEDDLWAATAMIIIAS
jgi:hypothetical protein